MTRFPPRPISISFSKNFEQMKRMGEPRNLDYRRCIAALGHAQDFMHEFITQATTTTDPLKDTLRRLQLPPEQEGLGEICDRLDEAYKFCTQVNFLLGLTRRSDADRTWIVLLGCTLYGPKKQRLFYFAADFDPWGNNKLTGCIHYPS